MNACSHVALYYYRRAVTYRRLHWWRAWEMARKENQRYALASIGVIDEEN